MFFPEGTFTRRPGLSGFYLGAFKVAAEAGSAGVARDHPRHPHDAAQRPMVSAASAMSIGSKSRSSRQARISSRSCATRPVRQVVLARCGEPDIGELVKPAPTSPV